MKILVLCTDSYGGYGGIALYNRDFIEALAAHPRVDEVEVIPRVISSGTLEPRPPNVRFVADGAGGRLRYLREIRKLLAERPRFDLVVCGHVNLLPFARMFQRPTALLIYGIEAWKEKRKGTARHLSHVDAVVSISDITRDRFVGWSHFAGPTHILPNAIHLDWYGVRERDAALASRLGVEGRRVVLTFGRIELAERYKGFDEVLDVLPQLIRAVPDIAYVVAGSGGDVPRLRRKAAQLGVSDRVVFTGMVEESEKPALYGIADVYAMPSRGEGFGFVLLEALACGVPVIASRHDGGYEAIRRGELGRAVDPASAAEIRTAIVETLGERKRGVPEGLDYFAFPRFVSRLHSIVDAITTSNEARVTRHE